VLKQQQHATFGHTQILPVEGAAWLAQGTKQLKLVLRLDADDKTDLFELSFKADDRNRMRPFRKATKRGDSEDAVILPDQEA
jgi:hypothetical protein